MNTQDSQGVLLTNEREYLLEVLRLADKMMEISRRGTRFASDNGCLILYGVIRDCAFKIRKIAQEELMIHSKHKAKDKED